MQIRLNLIKGQTGTKKLTHTYGDQLVCVPYRYDEEIPWVKNIGSTSLREPTKPDAVVSVRVGYDERHVRAVIKTAGGKWDSTEKVWSLPYRKAVEIGLEKRIVQR